ncbi:hypothetical protein HDU85_003914 [Gaertneriomyces sp. JEL0708]|nr:hypothetical protein HDU85_003914 [Gaertneriomyces sp. JEL0708]
MDLPTQIIIVEVTLCVTVCLIFGGLIYRRHRHEGIRVGSSLPKEASYRAIEEGIQWKGPAVVGPPKQNKTTMSVKDETKDLPTFRVVKSVKSTRKDEMTLEEGDIVMLSMMFTDGWAFGYNHTAKCSGMFPFHAVAPTTRTEPVVSQTSPLSSSSSDIHDPNAAGLKPKDSACDLSNGPGLLDPPAPPPKDTEHKLLFSLLPPTEAMHVVSDALTDERRRWYFHDTASEGSVSSRDSFEGETRAQRAWGQLRSRWREAVQKQLSDGYEEWLRRREEKGFDIWEFVAESYRIA